ncbi:MAG: T9SS type A sorting domain-containing protein [Bacteroidales bacterium]|nr:T9SS type A sorting domain-containing protein [Bacteroidales bacterium]
MKKIILSLSFLLFTVLAFSQPLILIHDDVELTNDAIVQIDSTLGGSGMAVVHILVKNNSSQEMFVKVRRTVIDTIPGSMNYFCWAGQCFSPDVYDSPSSEQIAEGATTGPDRFYADYYSGEQFGTTTMRYTFYNEFNPTDTASVIVNFNYGYASINDLLAKSKISNAYPNPASSKVSFNYDLPSQVNDASVKLYNIVGQEVKSENLLGNSGRLEMQLSNLNEGVYFMTLYLNKEAAKTSRIIVQK